MSDTIILLISIIITAIISGYIASKFSDLKHKNNTVDNSGFEKEIEQLKLQNKSEIERLESSYTIQNKSLKEQLEKLETEKSNLRDEKEQVSIKLSVAYAENENLKQQIESKSDDLKKQQEQLRKDFELMASKILDEKSEKFTIQNKENIKNILHPLQEKIQGFEKKVEDTQMRSVKMHSALEEQLKGLKDLNQKMTIEATNLTKALKGDSKTQGNWGELVLERVLEKSGLEKGREYFVQQNFNREDGSRVMPDVVLHLPDNKKMIIDSKVSLTDYERYANAEKEDQDVYLKSHVNSIKRHVDQLSAKNYQDLYDIDSPDFVLMFIPIEPAFAIALNDDNTLYNKAFEKNIVIVTPSTLLATLRTIDTMWNNEKQQQNAIEIARQAGGLYDKFEGLITDLTGVGKKIDAAKNDYSLAMNKLVDGKGNLITRIENLKKMGAKAKKSLPESIVNRALENE